MPRCNEVLCLSFVLDCGALLHVRISLLCTRVLRNGTCGIPAHGHEKINCTVDCRFHTVRMVGRNRGRAVSQRFTSCFYICKMKRTLVK